MLAIEMTNVCNFKCYFCSARTIKEFRKIDMKTFKNIIDVASELGITHLKLTPSNGEIFTDKDILKKLEYIENSTIADVEFHTNFSLVTHDIQEVLKTFKKIRIYISDYGNGNLEDFKYLTQMSDKHFRNYQLNIENAKRIGLNITLTPRGMDYDFCFDTTDDESLDDKYRYQRDHDEPIINSGVCSLLYIPRVLSNGDFTYCTCSGDSHDLPKDFIIGNIYETPFRDLYLSPLRLKMINEHKQNIYCDFCKNCDVFSTTTYQPKLSTLKNIIRIKNENS